MSGSAPIVEVDYDQLTYELLLEAEKKSELHVETNRASSPMERIFSDVFGLLGLYIITFLVCDLLRTLKTGNWSSLMWIVLGPYKYVTGAPMITKIAEKMIDKRGDPVSHCQTLRDDAKSACKEGSFLLPGPFHVGTGGDDYDECMQKADDAYADCIEGTPQYSQCVNDTNAVYDEYKDENLPIKIGSGYDSIDDYCLQTVGGVEN